MDTLIEYAGCGCAGGLITTIKGPITDAYGVTGSTIQTNKRRTQKIYQDVLGHTIKTELWDLDGASLFSTVENEYNGRGQITKVRQIDNTQQNSPSPHYQETVTTYDGHGRVSTMKRPEYTAPVTTTYNKDDTVATVTDPRGAVTTYTYENESSTPKRPLLTGIAYATPTPSPSPEPHSLNIPASSAVTFKYDNLGNRASMTDGTGTLTYSYDELSRLTAETREFDDDLPAAPPGGFYTIAYQYHPGGSLKSITDPFGLSITYNADKLGRVEDIGWGIYPTGVASGITYRAFGAVKSMSISTAATTTVAMTYDNAMRTLTYEADNSTTGSDFVQKANYTYHNDGLIKEIDNLRDGNFDQKNDYDFAGRLKKNTVGPSGATFYQNLDYSAFDELIGRTTQTYDLGELSSNSSKAYDAAGNVVRSITQSQSLQGGGSWHTDTNYWFYDAAGKMSRWEEEGPWGNQTKRGGETTFDGDGRPVKHAELLKRKEGGTWGEWSTHNWYYIYSSVTGQKINDILYDGDNAGTKIYLGDTAVWDNTYQGPFFESNDPFPSWALGFKVTEPVSGSTQQLDGSGQVPSADPNARNELAGLGTSVPTQAPENPYPPNPHVGGYAGNSDCIIQWDGFEIGRANCGPLELAGADGSRGYSYIYYETSGGFIPVSLFGPAAPNPLPDYDILKNSVDECASQMFKVRVTRIDWSSEGHDGKMDFKVDGADVRNKSSELGFTYPSIRTFTVYNDATSYSSEELDSAGKGGFGSKSGFYRTYSPELKRNVNTNQTFTARNAGELDILTPNGVMQHLSNFESLQIHETGNALARLTGVPHRAGSWIDPASGITYYFGEPGTDKAKTKYVYDHDSGQAFELCVMKAYRRLTGYQ